jgi:hypothetical protein
MQVEGQMLVVLASIVKKGSGHSLFLHPIRESGRVLSDLYLKKRAASGRRNSSISAVILAMRPIIEQKTNTTGGP